VTSIDKGATTLSITTLDIMRFSIILTKRNPQHMLTDTYADCHMLSVDMLSVVMPSVVILNVFVP
jgi:hypothetical protein